MTELVKEIPTDPQVQKYLKGAVKELVDAMLEIQGAKELISSIKDVVKQKYGIDPAWFEGLAKISYSERYDDNKVAMKIEAEQDKLDQYDTHIKVN